LRVVVLGTFASAAAKPHLATTEKPNHYRPSCRDPVTRLGLRGRLFLTPNIDSLFKGRSCARKLIRVAGAARRSCCAAVTGCYPMRARVADVVNLSEPQVRVETDEKRASGLKGGRYQTAMRQVAPGDADKSSGRRTAGSTTSTAISSGSGLLHQGARRLIDWQRTHF